ncbi:MAG TPA: amidohydrolase family protein [Clostridiaceae bacterium]|nr:amidohydrolase family protein [Clostridiaceae bacterium]
MISIIAITNTHIVLKDHLILNGVIITEGDRIVNLGEMNKTDIPGNAQIIDANGNYTGPGLIDIHTHAGGNAFFTEDPQRAAEHHLRHGTTSILPALYYNLSREQFLDGISMMKNASKTGSGRIIKGLYMEGPYLNPKFGCEAENNKWTQGIKREEYELLIEEVGDFAKVWCIAPELEGIEEFVADVKKAIPGIVFSVAHSEASPLQIERFIPFGLKLATHHTNATGDLPKYPECRGVCVDETVNFNDDIYAELICDSRGIHVDPYMLRLVLKIKGKDRIILISDAFVSEGPVPEGYEDVDDINFDFAGEIAGSKLTLNIACRNMFKHTGSSLCDVFRFASYNPAKLLNMSGYGEIAAGNKADLIIVDHLMNVKKVILSGEIII